MKLSEMTKDLRKAGCTIKREGAEHQLWYSPITGKIFAVPRHAKELKTGTAEKIRKDAGLK